MGMTLADAKSQVYDMLRMAGNNADLVARAIDRAQRGGKYTTEDDADYAMLRLALSDITGNAAYRMSV